MAYSYCHYCQSALGPPEVRTVLANGYRVCPECGMGREFTKIERSDALLDLLDRVEKLEGQLCQRGG